MAKPRILDANQMFIGTEPNWKDVDPEFIKQNQKLLIIRTLNWYAANASAKESDEYFKKFFPKLKPAHTVTVGYLCRMVSRGFPKELIWDRIVEAAAKLPVEKTVVERVKPVKVEPKFKEMDKVSDDVCTKLDYAIDDIIKKKMTNPTFSVSGFNKKQLEEVRSFAVHHLSEFEGAADKEEYTISKRQENAIVGMLRRILQLIQQESPAEKVRKPRKVREVPAEKIVKNFTVTDFGAFKTLPAVKLHGATIALMFDSKIRRVSVFVAEQGKLLSVKGKSIINFDESKSFSKVLRKPEEQLKDLISAAKTNILKKVENIKAVSGNPKFRSSETTILLKTW